VDAAAVAGLLRQRGDALRRFLQPRFVAPANGDRRAIGGEAVSAEDVQRVAQRYLDPAGRNLVRVLPSNAKSGAGGKGGS